MILQIVLFLLSSASHGSSLLDWLHTVSLKSSKIMLDQEDETIPKDLIYQADCLSQVPYVPYLSVQPR